MKLTNSEKTGTNQYLLEISVGAEEFEAACEKAYRKEVKRMNVPGFRKGKAPRKMVEKLYGEGIFFEDAINSLYPSAYSAAVEEAKIEPVDRPEIEMSDVDKSGFSFKATVTVKPEVSVKDYKGIHVVKNIPEVADEEVEAELGRVRERAGRIVPVEGRAAQDGNTAVINFEGFSEGVAFEGGKGENYPLQLGSGQFIPGFEEQVVGKNIDDEFEVNVTFPETYNEKSLAGKPAVFKCKLNELKSKELPELDDEFAKDMSEFSTLDEFKADIRAKALDRKMKLAQDEVEDHMIDIIIGNMEAEIPECMFEQRIDQSVREFDYRLQSQGMNIDAYLQYTGMEMDAFRKTFAAQAEKQVKIRLALEKIAELEGLTASNEEIENMFEDMAKNYNMKAEEVKRAVSKVDIEQDIAMNKAVDLIHEAAIVTEAAAEAADEKKAPKKKAAKKKDEKADDEE